MVKYTKGISEGIRALHSQMSALIRAYQSTERTNSSNEFIQAAYRQQLDEGEKTLRNYRIGFWVSAAVIGFLIGAYLL